MLLQTDTGMNGRFTTTTLETRSLSLSVWVGHVFFLKLQILLSAALLEVFLKSRSSPGQAKSTLLAARGPAGVTPYRHYSKAQRELFLGALYNQELRLGS